MTEDAFTPSSLTRRSNLLPAAPNGRRSIGVALEGGGALGLAHIGVLKWMEEHHIPVDRIAGTSMGCLVSALYASGKTPREMEILTESDVFSNVLTLRSAYSKSSLRRKQDQFEIPQALTIGLRGGISLRNSLLADQSLNSFLMTQLFTYDREGIDFDRLPIPLRCVATDLDTMKPVVFRGGPLPVAIRASLAIPGVFAPVLYQGHHLVDGAIMDNLPTGLVKDDLRSDIVLGIHLKGPELAANDMKSLVGVFARAYAAGTAMNERRSAMSANMLITVDTNKFTSNDYGQARGLIDQGYAAAEESRKQLLAYSLSDADWAAYLEDRRSREHAAPGVLTEIQVGGEEPSVRDFVTNDLSYLMGKQMNPEQIAEQLTQIQSDGSLQTRFGTFAPRDPKSIQRPISTEPDTGLLVQFRPVPSGPPFLLTGPEIAAETSNVTRTIFAFRLIDQNFGGYGSELRTDIRAGYFTSISSEYYRRLGPKNFYLQPRLLFDRRPIYIWQDQQRVGEQFQQMAGGGIDLGRTFNNQLQIHASWTAQVMRWNLVNGVSVGSSISGTSQTGLFHITYDGAGSSTVSGRGFRLDASAGALYRGPVGERAPLSKLYALKSINFGKQNIFFLSGEASTYFRHAVSQPLRFTLGGPFRLSASSLDEYRGTDTLLLRAGYLHQIASLPTGLGQGLYATFAYEGGEVWSPETTALLRQNAVAALVAATPIGAITFGTAIGDAGRRKVIFAFGRIF